MFGYTGRVAGVRPAFLRAMSYAIISLGGKQYRVQEGDRLVVDRLGEPEGKTFNPKILFLGGDGKAELGPKGTTVTAKVVGHVLGEKIRVGKYRRRTGYRRHTGHRSRLTEVEIQSIGGKSAKPKEEKPKAETTKAAAPKRTTTKKPAAKKPAAKKE
jgi:large subunit ribosomal protein L21